MAASLLAASRAAADEPTVLVTIDPAKVAPAVKARWLQHVASTVPVEKWREVRVNDRDTLYSIIRSEYGLSDVTQHASASVVVQVLARGNDLESADKITAGAVLRVPPLPHFSPDAPRGAQTQYVDPAAGAVRAIIPVACGSADWAACDTAAGSAATWSVPLPLSAVASLTDGLSEEDWRKTKRNILLGDPAQLVELRDADDGVGLQGGAGKPAATPSLGSLAGAPMFTPPPALPAGSLASYKKKLYVLDRFGESGCSHGRKVLDVVRQTLRALNAEALLDNVVPIELAFSADATWAANPALRDYRERFDDRIQDMLDAKLRETTDALKKLKGDKVPALWLNALFDFVANDPNASVVTSSFLVEKGWAGSNYFSVLPSSVFSALGQRVLFVSAAGNSATAIENAEYEPQKTYHHERSKLGSVLVGALDRNGAAFGTYSTTGVGVDCVAPGTGYGFEKSCIRPDDEGTSFAAPAVSTLLFVTRAYWEAQGLSLTRSSSGDGSRWQGCPATTSRSVMRAPGSRRLRGCTRRAARRCSGRMEPSCRRPSPGAQ